MNGRIGVVSTPGQGSTFWFTAEFERQSGKESGTPAKEPELRNSRALVVAASASVREMLTRHVTRCGGVVDGVEDGYRAIAVMKTRAEGESPYRLVLMDAAKPAGGMGGPEFLRSMKQDPSLAQYPVIMLTPFDQRGQAEAWHHQGAAACVAKPVRFAELRSCIMSVLSAPPPTAPAESRERAAARFTCRVLVAEDNPVNQKVAAGMLKKLGCRVDLVANGLEAMDAMARTAYDLIFMDCQMPEMDGFEAAREIHRREARSREGVGRQPRVPIIAMTANVMQGSRDRCLEAGMDDFISKPISQEALQHVLRRWMPTDPGRRPDGGSEGPDSGDGPPAEDVFDRTAALARLEGDRVLLAELAIIFLRHASDMVANIQKATERRDFPALEQAAHSLKGSAANLCASRVAGAADCLERVAQVRDGDRLTPALQRLHRELSGLRLALTSYSVEARPCAS
jgi:two-component system sensor histidine kinase/response regulator